MRITLVPITLADADFLYTMMQDKDFQKYYLTRLIVKSSAQAKKLIHQWQRETKRGLHYCFVIRCGKDTVGTLEVYKINKKDQRGSLGYCITRSFWNKGIATSATKQGLTFMKKVGLHSCEATADPRNQASCAVLEKNGFEKVGVMKDYYYDNDTYVDRVLYWKVL